MGAVCVTDNAGVSVQFNIVRSGRDEVKDIEKDIENDNENSNMNKRDHLFDSENKAEDGKGDGNGIGNCIPVWAEGSRIAYKLVSPAHRHKTHSTMVSN